MWHFQLVPCAAPRHWPRTWRSPPPLLFLTTQPRPFHPLELQSKPALALTLWHHMGGQNTRTCPLFLPRVPCPGALGHGSSLIRSARGGTDWWRGAGSGRPVVVWDVRCDGRVRTGAALCWGQRRMDSSLLTWELYLLVSGWAFQELHETFSVIKTWAELLY